jgi:hypothetical protein
MITRRTAVVSLGPFLAACHQEPPVIVAPPTDGAGAGGSTEQPLGGNVSRIIPRTPVAPSVLKYKDFDEIYARFKIQPSINSANWGNLLPATPGTTAGKLWDALKQQFGGQTSRYTVMASQQIGGTELTFPLIDFEFNTRERKIRTALYTVETPYQRISRNQRITYKLHAAAVTMTTSEVGRKLSDVISVLANVGALAGAGPTAGLTVVAAAVGSQLFQNAANSIDNLIAQAFSNSVDSSAQQLIGPGQRLASDSSFFWNSDDWNIKTYDGYSIVGVKFTLEYASNMVSPEGISSLTDLSDNDRAYPDGRIKASFATSPLTFRTIGSESEDANTRIGTLKSALRANPSLQAYSTISEQILNIIQDTYNLVSEDALRQTMRISTDVGFGPSSNWATSDFAKIHQAKLIKLGYLQSI